MGARSLQLQWILVPRSPEVSSAAATSLRWSNCSRLGSILLLSSCLVGACTVAPPAAKGPTYAGELEVYLQPFDEKGLCSVTIGLRNVSGSRQGDANLSLAWFDAGGKSLGEQALRMDELRPERTDGKNLTLQARCKEVSRLIVRTAEWNLFEGWDTPARSVVRIDRVEGSEWQFSWDAENFLFVGTRRGL